MSEIRTRPASDEYRSGWDRIFAAKYQPRTICFNCGTEHDGNLEKCSDCGSTWLEKKYQDGIYALDAK